MKRQIALAPELNLEDQQRVWDGIREHAESIAGTQNRQPLHVAARGVDGRLLGGLIGASGWGWLAIESLWVDGAHRGSGVGTRLMELAEQEGRRRGCVGAFLETFSFEARGFYEKLGYRVHGVLEGQPPGHQRLAMHKLL